MFQGPSHELRLLGLYSYILCVAHVFGILVFDHYTCYFSETPNLYMCFSAGDFLADLHRIQILPLLHFGFDLFDKSGEVWRVLRSVN